MSAIECGKWRVVFYEQSGDWSLRDMTNAGKRGKRCADITIDSGCQYTRAWDAGNLHADLFNPPSADAPERLILAALRRGWKVSRDSARGIDVAPPSRNPVAIECDRWIAEFEWSRFSICDKLDRNNEPAIIPTRTPATKISKAYEFAASEGGRVAILMCSTIHEIADLLQNETGVKTHYYCRMD